MRNYSLLRALRMEGHELTLVAFGKREELVSARRALAGLCVDLDLVQEPSGAGYAGRLRALASRLPYGAWRMRSHAMRAAVSNHLARQVFDLVLCDDVYQIENLPALCQIPIILNKHTIVYEEVQRFLEHQRNPLVAAYGWTEYQRLRRLEMRACGTATAVWACSERDLQILVRDNSSVPIALVPNVIDTDGYQPSEGDDGRTVLFVGAMDWMPNRDAIEFFVRESWPRLRALAPCARLVVAGREPAPEFVRRFAKHPEITFTGTVANLRPLLSQAAVSIVPLRIGSGTRIKILEAASMGKTVVSTKIGAEGLRFANGSEIILEEAPLEFARAVAELLHDEPRRRRIGAAARRVVVEHYSMPALARALRSAFGTLSQNLWAGDTTDKPPAVAAHAKNAK